MTDRGTIEREAALRADEGDEPTPERDGGTEPVEPTRKRDDAGALFDRATASELERRWQAVQVGFVDEPRDAVEQADRLVAEVLDQLTSSFARERRDLEAAWSDGRQASTEDLRQAIRRYRAFFDRLLAV